MPAGTLRQNPGFIYSSFSPVLHLHIALKPKDIKKFFEPVFSQAENLQKAYDSSDPAKKPSFRVPFVTVSATVATFCCSYLVLTSLFLLGVS